ncbi:DivIVA domain-containing protein [Caldinitratiruptor microaerophilus]|uniref:Septum formation initiator n=1 Tax=Caldinitratiruptor microaerophilus TaxID=671077 RepID=A0AA35G8S2_9FIRM|nr:DivIVA domain-containing protein [Caldinitratiruptor microaerophilus]BDG60738.1 septum formation initiator [Caldinitratiruptor microaerophilus]
MGLTPMDIHNKQFSRALFGYHRGEVDDFLDQIIREFEQLLRENARLRDQVQLCEQQLQEYRSLESTINRTLVTAQEAAEEVKANARKEADLIIQEARLQAERLIEAGETKARRLLEENADLKRQAAELRAQLRNLLRGQMELLDRMLPEKAFESTGPAAPNAAPPPAGAGTGPAPGVAGRPKAAGEP